MSRDTKSSLKQVFRVRACESVGVWTYLLTCIVHGDMKVEAGLKLKIRMKHTRMLTTHTCKLLAHNEHAHKF